MSDDYDRSSSNNKERRSRSRRSSSRKGSIMEESFMRSNESFATNTEEAEEHVHPDTIPSSVPSSGTARPAPVPVSSSHAAAPAAPAPAANTTCSKQTVAFIEMDLIKKDPEEEEGRDGRKAALPETITSGDTTCTCTGAHAPPEQPTTTTNHDDKHNSNGVVIKCENSLADNGKRRRKEGLRTSIKSEGPNNNSGNVYSTKRTRRSSGKRKQFTSEENSANSNSNDSLNRNTAKNRRVGGRAGGGRRTATDNSDPTIDSSIRICMV